MTSCPWLLRFWGVWTYYLKIPRPNSRDIIIYEKGSQSRIHGFPSQGNMIQSKRQIITSKCNHKHVVEHIDISLEAEKREGNWSNMISRSLDRFRKYYLFQNSNITTLKNIGYISFEHDLSLGTSRSHDVKKVKKWDFLSNIILGATSYRHGSSLGGQYTTETVKKWIFSFKHHFRLYVIST